VKRSAASDLSFRPGSAPVANNNPLDDRQPDTRAFEFILVVQALEYTEEFPESPSYTRMPASEPASRVSAMEMGGAMRFILPGFQDLPHLGRQILH
jgi:hypothetical protein